MWPFLLFAPEASADDRILLDASAWSQFHIFGDRAIATGTAEWTETLETREVQIMIERATRGISCADRATGNAER